MPLILILTRILASLVLVAAGSAFAHDTAPAAAAPDSKVALDKGLGPLHHPVSTRHRQAQAYFDQGLKLVFAFNHEALQKAIVLRPGASPVERAYIDALSKRYGVDAEADVGPLQVAYKDAVKALVRRYPNDNDAAVLYAESLMDLNPWKLWAPDASPAEGTLEIVAVLERVLARQPGHIGANHYYIHAVEASKHPKKALASAKRLEALAPSAGHLVHMPAHVYIRTGDYLYRRRWSSATTTRTALRRWRAPISTAGSR